MKHARYLGVELSLKLVWELSLKGTAAACSFCCCCSADDAAGCCCIHILVLYYSDYQYQTATTRYQKSVKYGAILGGSEEIMADLGMFCNDSMIHQLNCFYTATLLLRDLLLLLLIYIRNETSNQTNAKELLQVVGNTVSCIHAI